MRIKYNIYPLDGIIELAPEADELFICTASVSLAALNRVQQVYKGIKGAHAESKTSVVDDRKKAIEMAKPGNRVYDISETIERQVRGAGLTPVEDLVGHGIGKDLHEEPQIPCFSRGKREESPLISQGAVLAIEVMYVKGKKDLVLGHDGWTISTKDG